MPKTLQNWDGVRDFSIEDRFVFDTDGELKTTSWTKADGQQSIMVWTEGYGYAAIVNGVSEDEKEFFEELINNHNAASQLATENEIDQEDHPEQNRENDNFGDHNADDTFNMNNTGDTLDF